MAKQKNSGSGEVYFNSPSYIDIHKVNHAISVHRIVLLKHIVAASIGAILIKTSQSDGCPKDIKDIFLALGVLASLLGCIHFLFIIGKLSDIYTLYLYRRKLVEGTKLTPREKHEFRDMNSLENLRFEILPG